MPFIRPQHEREPAVESTRFKSLIKHDVMSVRDRISDAGELVAITHARGRFFFSTQISDDELDTGGGDSADLQEPMQQIVQ